MIDGTLSASASCRTHHAVTGWRSTISQKPSGPIGRSAVPRATSSRHRTWPRARLAIEVHRSRGGSGRRARTEPAQPDRLARGYHHTPYLLGRAKPAHSWKPGPRWRRAGRHQVLDGTAPRPALRTVERRGPERHGGPGQTCHATAATVNRCDDDPRLRRALELLDERDNPGWLMERVDEQSHPQGGRRFRTLRHCLV